MISVLSFCHVSQTENRRGLPLLLRDETGPGAAPHLPPEEWHSGVCGGE